MTTPALLKRGEAIDPTGVRRALIVEDQSDISDLIDQIIRPLGFVTVRASNGEDAVRLARAIAPSVITLDLNLPLKDGHEVLLDLASDPTTRDIPVIVISAYTPHVKRTEQVVGILGKPFEIEDLQQTITVATGQQ
ncbi:MAG: response regulator [Chloroflexota bacterium]